MKFISVVVLVLITLLVGMHLDTLLSKPTPEEQCLHLQAIQWCMANSNSCQITVGEIEEAKYLHEQRVCHKEE